MTKTETTLRLDTRVAEVSDERAQDAGIWVYLRKGLCNGEDCAQGHHADTCVHAVHESTWTQCAARLRAVSSCDCATCAPQPLPGNHMPKPTLKHMQPNGVIATRQTARSYTHVLLCRRDSAARIAELESHRASNIVDAAKRATRQHAEWLVEKATGIGGQVPYWPGQGGYGKGRTHEQPDYQYNSACEYLAKYPTAEAYVAQCIKDTNEHTDQIITDVRNASPDWHVISWHSRADLAKPSYTVVAGDHFTVEAINNGVREPIADNCAWPDTHHKPCNCRDVAAKQ